MNSFHYKDIVACISSEKLEQLTKEAQVDYKVSKLTGKEVFNLLLFSVLEKDELSLRTIEGNYLKLFNDTTRHSSIASRLKTINVEFFKSIFLHVSEEFLNLSHYKKLLIIDSTTLQLSNKLLKIGSPCRQTANGTKNLVKCIIAKEEEFATKLKLHTGREGSSDSALFKEMIIEHGKESICVFDRGLQKRATFQEFSQKNISFVTRGNENINYKLVRENKLNITENEIDLKIIEDNIVNLRGKKTGYLPFEIRLIKAVHKETGKKYSFLTNIHELSASEISDFYKQRWSIEVFFRFIKQELNMRHFLGYNHNTIEVTLYMLLIASVLLIEYKKRTKIPSYKFARRAFMDELMLEVFKPIVAFCGGDPEKVYKYYEEVLLRKPF